MSISAGAIVPESRERLRFREIAKFVEDFEQVMLKIKFIAGAHKLITIISTLLQLSKTAAACRPTVKVDYHSFKGTMKTALGYPKDESTIIIKPSFPATGSPAVETSQSGE